MKFNFKREVFQDLNHLEQQCKGYNILNKQTIKILNYLIPKIQTLEGTKLMLKDNGISKKLNFCNFWEEGTTVFLRNNFGNLILDVKLCTSNANDGRTYNTTTYYENHIYIAFRHDGILSAEDLIEYYDLNKIYSYKKIVKAKDKIYKLQEQILIEKKKFGQIKL